MKLLQKKGDANGEEIKRRNRLLALLHIAKTDLHWSEQFYREFLEANFQVPTAAALSNDELAKIVAFIMNEWGWRPKWNNDEERTSQIAALRQRIINFGSQIPDGEKRVQGLCRKLCGVDRVEWCSNANKLKRLLAALGNIKRKESVKDN